MHIPGVVLVQRHWLKKNVVVVHCSCYVTQVNNLVNVSIDFECVWIHLLADLTLKSFPIKWSYILILSIWRFFLLLCKNPILQALKVNQTDSTSALTCNNEWIRFVMFTTPADSALDLVSICIVQIFNTDHIHCLLQFLIVKFLLSHLNAVTSEIFYSESNSSKFNSIEFLDFIVILASFIFKWSCN
jgi:hypothetical protein